MNSKDTSDLLAVHSILPVTSTNGPGLRFGLWLQGCNQRCPGCFNPHMQEILEPDAGTYVPGSKPGWIRFDRLADLIKQQHVQSPIDGISVSGGEPFLQPEPLRKLLESVKQIPLTTLIFTGYTMEELKGRGILKEFRDPVPLIDILVDGPYQKENHLDGELRGSANQRIIFLTDKYGPEDIVQPGCLEVILEPDGTTIVTGFTRPPSFENHKKKPV